MRVVVLILVSGALCFAEQTAKPACNKKSQGQFWPAQANVDKVLAQQLYRQGELEMCTFGVWKYKWEHVSVRAHKPAKASGPEVSRVEPGTERATGEAQ